MDRNSYANYAQALARVAPLAGSVDRNTPPDKTDEITQVAPLAGSVDRNLVPSAAYAQYEKSLPSRGAWIEMSSSSGGAPETMVAPLAGSVDSNPSSLTAWLRKFSRSPRGERG